jgi:outer membrane protein TolC
MCRHISSCLPEKGRKRLLVCLIAGLGLASSPAVRAIDLLQSYRLAVANEPAYQAARASAAASREALPQAKAQLLPNVQASGTRSQADTTQMVPNIIGQEVTRSFSYPSYNYSLTVRQPLYRMQSWANYRQAEARVTGAEADLENALKDLGVRVAEAYFNALLAEDVLASVLVQKEANLAQLNSAKRALDLPGQLRFRRLAGARSRARHDLFQEPARIPDQPTGLFPGPLRSCPHGTGAAATHQAGRLAGPGRGK